MDSEKHRLCTVDGVEIIYRQPVTHDGTVLHPPTPTWQASHLSWFLLSAAMKHCHEPECPLYSA